MKAATWLSLAYPCTYEIRRMKKIGRLGKIMPDFGWKIKIERDLEGTKER